MSDILSALQWRYAVKKFDAAKKIDPATWAKLEDCLVLSPSSFGLQAWKFFVIDDPATRQKLQPAAYGQTQVVDASHLVVFAVKKNTGPEEATKWVQRIAEVRGVPAEKLEEYRGRMVGTFASQSREATDAWLSRQVYIALGVFLASAAVLGVDACPMEGLQPDKFDEILGLKEKGYASLVMATAGYRAADDAYAAQKKARYPKADVIEHV